MEPPTRLRSRTHRHRRREGPGPRRLAAPHRPPVPAPPRAIAGVTAIIVASSVLGMASPFLLRAVIDTALPNRDLPLLAALAGGMVAVAALTAALGVVQTWVSTRVGQQVMHRLRTDVFTHLQRQSHRLLHQDPHRRGAVAHHQRRRRPAVGRHQHGDLDRGQPDHDRRHGRRDGRAVLAALADLPRRAPPVDLADPPRRADAARDHVARSSGSWPTSTSRSRRASRSTARSSRARWAPGPRSSPASPARRSG